MKELIKMFIPNFVLRARLQYLKAKRQSEFMNLTPNEVFTKIYLDGAWGRSINPRDRYYSGTGSHDEYIVSTYVNSVERYLKSHNMRPNVVDLGCGDFAVGSRIRDFCGTYTACDVVEPLIVRNKRKFKDRNVEFLTLDLTTDNLPVGDLVFVRQVLQHLSNKQIESFLSKLIGKYKYLVLTEHLPSTKNFRANLDKPVGADIRLGMGDNGSGIVLTEPPFNFPVKNETVLCEVHEGGGIIRTNIYELA